MKKRGMFVKLIKQPKGFKPDLKQIDEIANVTPKAILDAGASISLLALAYAIWMEHQRRKKEGLDKSIVGLTCLKRVKKTVIKFGRKKIMTETCGAKIISASEMPKPDGRIEIRMICSKKHVTRVLVEVP